MNGARRHPIIRRARWPGLLAAAVLAVAACSSGATPAPSATPVAATPVAATPVAATPVAATPVAAACQPSDIKLVVQVRSVSNPYEASLLTGGEFFGKTVGLPVQKLTYGGDSQLQDSQIRTLLASGNPKCIVMNVLPNGNQDTPVLVKAADGAGAWIVTQWNKDPALYPWDGHPTWVSHVTYDDLISGHDIAVALFEKMGGKGNIVALQGILATTSAKARFVGLQNALAEYPNIKLLDQQTGDFDRTKGLTITNTWLTKYGGEINGIWAANDDMGLGALQALKAAGKAGTVPIVAIDAVPEGIKAVKAGTFAATVSSDGYWQGGIGLAMGYCAATGQIDVAKLSHTDRAFYAKTVLITSTNVDKYLTAPTESDYVGEWPCSNLFNRVLGPIPSGQ